MGQYADTAKKVKRLKRNLNEEHENATEQGMDKVQSELRRALELNESVARGVLLKDIERISRTTSEPANETVSMPEWAKYLEHGTGSRGTDGYKAPDNPPYAAIREWFESPRGPEPETGSVTASTELVAESIAEDGTHPHPFIGPVWDSKFGSEYIIHLNRVHMTRALRRSF